MICQDRKAGSIKGTGYWEKIKKNNNKQVNFYAIKSDFGVEIVDPLNKDKLNKEMELTIITNKNIKQMRDISEYLMQDTKSK